MDSCVFHPYSIGGLSETVGGFRKKDLRDILDRDCAMFYTRHSKVVVHRPIEKLDSMANAYS